jgi:O-antigen ligase
LMAALLPSRRVRLFVALSVVVVVLIASMAPEYLLQRGFSYRPVLFMGGLELFKEHVLLGLGFIDYEIFVPGNGNYYKHPHNMYLDVAIRLGLPGLLLFAALWLSVAWRAWENRKQRLGQALLALWFFASVSLLSDGIGLWFKPNADWFVTWLPIALSLVLAYRGASAKA